MNVNINYCIIKVNTNYSIMNVNISNYIIKVSTNYSIINVSINYCIIWAIPHTLLVLGSAASLVAVAIPK